MSIKQVFSQGKAVIPYLVCGYPDLAATEELVRTLAEAGASLIELGIPFSDPAADPPLIQRINEEALAGGVTTDQIFDLVQGLRTKTEIPLAFRAYANLVYKYGTERFLARAAELGIKALTLPDVPYEEREEFARVCSQAGVALTSVVAPASGARIEKIAREAQGYICLSLPPGFNGFDWAALRRGTALPAVVPLGGSSLDQLGETLSRADGVIIDAEVMETVAEHGEDASSFVYNCVKNIIHRVREIGMGSAV